MAILIRGMEMPTSCDKCSYSAWSNFYQIYVCNAARKNEPVLFDGKQTKSTAVARSARADNCPLVEIPPLGRLIDADALMQEFEKAQRTMKQHGQEYSCSFLSSSQEISTEWYCVEDMVENAPTIIPAEEGET